MKDFAWVALGMVLFYAAALLDDYRGERCADRGDRWRQASACSPGTCERMRK